MASPNSYLDPYWSDLAARAAKRNDVPPDLLVAVLTKGERSNANQVSEKGAKTPFQITDEARNLVLKRDGVDAYLSDDNAADVAARVLKDGMNFAKNKAETPQEQRALAAGFYHAGGDFKNWGQRTKNYVARVTGGEVPTDQPAAVQSQQPQRAPSQQSIIARAYDAYRAGRMSPQDAAEFEADVNSGAVELPLGSSLKRRVEPAADSFKVPQSVVDAYTAGKMSPQDAAEFESDMRANPGLVPEGLTIKPYRAEIPVGENEGAGPNYVSPPAAPDPTIGEQIVGAGETALAIGTGMTGGSVGAVKGFVGGLADRSVTNIRQLEQATQQGAESLTYAPRTAAGQAQTQAVGNAAANLIPIAPLAPQMAAIRRAGQVAKPTAQVLAQTVPQVARETAVTAAQNVAAGARAIPERVGQMMGREATPTPTPGTMGSVGSAGTDIATQRRTTAQSFDVPVKLTEGEAGRQHPQMQFEGETAKLPNKAGEMLRQRSAENNAAIIRNFDTWMDKTERQATDAMGVGKSLAGALDKGLENRKNEYRVKYAAAEKAGETAAPVDTTPVAKAINESFSAEGSAPIIGATKRELIRLGGGSLDENGNVVGGQMSIKDMEALRKFVGRTAKENDGTDVFYAGQMRNGIDTVMDSAPGNLFKDARASFRRTQELYKDNALIKDLISQKKGTTDRKVALENVVNRTILGGSRDDLGKLRRTLLVDGSEEGKQAWKDIQGATLQHIADEANANPVSPKSAVTDIHGNPVVSAAGLNKVVNSLEKGGKLEFLLGKQGAQKVRDINEIVGLLKTFPPGTVNTSNTGAILIAALTEAGGNAALTGLPIPVLSALRAGSQYIKDRRLRMRVAEALGDAKRKEAAKPKPIPMKKTVH